MKSSRVDAMAAAGLFAAVSSPSLKLLLPAALVNVTPVLLIGFGLLSRPVKWSPSHRFILALWTIFTLVFLIVAFPRADLEGLSSLMKSIYLIAVVFAAVPVSNMAAVRSFVRYVVLWGAGLAFWQLFFGLEIDYSKNQHYNTVAMPIALALNVCFVAALDVTQTKLWERMVLIIIVVTCSLALATLIGRAAIVFSAAIFTLAVGAKIIQIRKRRRVSKAGLGNYLLLCFLIVGGVLVMVKNFVNLQSTYRTTKLIESPLEESRLALYAEAIDFIGLSPIAGHGLGSSWRLLGYYPHNFLLETMMNGGLVLLLPLAFLLIVTSFRLLRVFFCRHSDRYLVALSAVSIYVLLQWSVSYSFATFYIALIPLILLYVSSEKPWFQR